MQIVVTQNTCQMTINGKKRIKKMLILQFYRIVSCTQKLLVLQKSLRTRFLCKIHLTTIFLKKLIIFKILTKNLN